MIKWDVGRMFLLPVLSLTFLLLSNKFVSMDHIGVKEFARDSRVYQAIALDQTDTFTPFMQHHLERFVYLKMVGQISKLTSLSIETNARVLTFILILAIIGSLFFFLRQHNIDFQKQEFLLLILILNGFFFRYYLAFPLMFVDLIAILCSIQFLSLWPYGKKNSHKVLGVGALILGVMAKQSLLAVAFGVLSYSVWKKKNRTLAFGSMIILGFQYLFLNQAIGHYEVQNRTLEHLYGLFGSPFFFFKTLKLIASIMIAIGLLACLLVRVKDRNMRWKEVFALHKELVFSIGIFLLLPLLAGTELTGNAGTRLSLLAFVPMLMLVGVCWNGRFIPSKWHYILIFLTSWHVTFMKGFALKPDYPWFSLLYLLCSGLFLFEQFFIRKVHDTSNLKNNLA